MEQSVFILIEACHATEDSLQELESMARENHKIVAIGEIGLDYHYFL